MDFFPFKGDMSTTCWSLWQRMPPRYQLTSRREEVDVPDERCRTPVPTPRSQRPGAKRGAITIATKTTFTELPQRNTRDVQSSGRRSHFPNRKSGYIDHFKTQQRVNSAKVKFSSNPPTSPFSPRERASTAPHFPVTKLETSVSGPEISAANVRDICSEHKATGGRIRTPIGRQRQTATDLEDATTLFTESKSILKDASQRRLNVRETAEGTMYLDNGKVFFIKRSRHDPTNLLKSRSSDGGFLASIRKDYLKKPKYLATKGEKPEQEDSSTLQHERVYYNQKVGHILDYYSRDDEDRLSIDDLAKYTRSSPRTAFSRNASPRSSKVRKLYFAPDADELSPRRSPDMLDDPNINSYMKVNFQSKLYDRKFYLRTPNKPNEHFSTTDIDNCKCGICKIEMQLSLMEKLGIGYPFAKMQTQQIAVQKQTTQEGSTHNVAEDNPETGNQDGNMLMEESRESTNGSKAGEANSNKQPENSSITITVPGMNLEREGTQTESMIETARTPYTTPVPNTLVN
uniref:Uncharacterized protein LOC111132825 isoform X2 n=1 Tax=Crassostrea virginica TaxID=6565 RepID=A0A8B8E6Y3_CRAVI|nr:uncharacterized protein LOC111132825 isoform X2 [Crassostrea virginica]